MMVLLQAMKVAVDATDAASRMRGPASAQGTFGSRLRESFSLCQ
jgi:hypothetical protein